MQNPFEFNRRLLTVTLALLSIVLGRVCLGQQSQGTLAGYVYDSVTKSPLAGAMIVLNADSTTTTLPSGSFNLHVSSSSTFTLSIYRENYRSFSLQSKAPSADTFHASFALIPSEVQGTFEYRGATGSQTDKMLAVDSLGLLVFNGNFISNSTDSGATWSTTLRNPTPFTGRDFYARGRAECWVAGDGGGVAHSNDTGTTWQNIASPRHANLYGICGVNDNLWFVGDSGVILSYSNGHFRDQSDPYHTQTFRAVHFIDTGHGVAVGDSGIFAIYKHGYWSYRNVNIGWRFRTCYTPYPGDYFAAGDSGKLIAYHESDDPEPQIIPFLVTRNNMRSLYFLNRAIGFVVGSPGGDFVTYDSGHSWAPLPEFTRYANNINFSGLTGYTCGTNGSKVFRGYPFPPNSVGVPYIPTSILMGHITGDSGRYNLAGIPVMIRKGDGTYDTAETNEQGNFVFTHVPWGGTPITMQFWNARGEKWYHVETPLVQIGTPAVVNYDTSESSSGVSTGSRLPPPHATCSIDASTNLATLDLIVSEPTELQATLYDELGRVILRLADGMQAAGTRAVQFSLAPYASGIYFIGITIPGGQHQMLEVSKL